MTNIKVKAYEEIVELLDKYDDIIKDDAELDNRGAFRERIRIEEIEEEFGIPIKDKRYQSSHNIQLTNDNWRHRIVYYSGDNETQYIGCSDDGRQPKDERLYVISFPTGPYIFGDEYPTDTFDKFYNELKAFGPRYSDRMNKSLYFTSDVAKLVWDRFDDIYKKWEGEVEKELKQRRIDELKYELNNLEND